MIALQACKSLQAQLDMAEKDRQQMDDALKATQEELVFAHNEAQVLQHAARQKFSKVSAYILLVRGPCIKY